MTATRGTSSRNHRLEGMETSRTRQRPVGTVEDLDQLVLEIRPSRMDPCLAGMVEDQPGQAEALDLGNGRLGILRPSQLLADMAEVDLVRRQSLGAGSLGRRILVRSRMVAVGMVAGTVVDTVADMVEDSLDSFEHSGMVDNLKFFVCQDTCI